MNDMEKKSRVESRNVIGEKKRPAPISRGTRIRPKTISDS